MENKLKTVIEYGIERGWESPDESKYMSKLSMSERVDRIFMNAFNVEFEGSMFFCEELVAHTLFSHPFAKAFWGEHKIEIGKWGLGGTQTAYLFHLQAAVISDSPLDYYFDYISNHG